MHSKSSRRPTPGRPRPIASGARLARLRTSLRPRPKAAAARLGDAASWGPCNMTTEINGRCLCGGVSYVATAAPVMMLNCHCRDCQKASGGAFAAIAVFPKTSVQVHGDLRFHEVLSEH